LTAIDLLKHIEVKAPVGGIEHQLVFHTVGGVIKPAETLMEIVPQGSTLTAEARIAPQDIDQLASDQAATLRPTAFNRNTTPEVQGPFARFSPDLETDQQTGANVCGAAVAIHESEVASQSSSFSYRECRLKLGRRAFAQLLDGSLDFLRGEMRRLRLRQQNRYAIGKLPSQLV
jgi:hypothetical protein